MKVSEVITLYGGLKTRALRLRSDIESSKRKMEDSRALHALKVKELKDVKTDKVIQESAIQIMREIIDKLSQEHINMVSDMLTFALQTIFVDRNYSMKVRLGDKRNNKSAEFFLVEVMEDGSIIESEFNDGIGGGVMSIIGFTLQVFYIQYYNQARILFLDESLSQVSDEYIAPLLQFIKTLSKKKGFIFVLISHDDRLVSEADQVHLVEKGKVKLIKEYKEES